MTWIYLVIAGIFEVVWSTTMKLSQGFTKIGWAIATIIGMIAICRVNYSNETFTNWNRVSSLDRNWSCWISTSWFILIS